ncbi:MAG: 30S ribosomal protein S17e [Thaumarchaeota archaeon]|nr:30S ribosomal protein S17e [Nitrososphaerota archaeon]|tara:strand:- start:8853 stop:9062 length:210 start_codon:yes stop_codon:yes gene_type:complete
MAMLLLENFPDKFSTDFDKNKESLSEVTIVRSKQLRNELAGYLARTIALQEDDSEVSHDEDVVLENQTD